MARRLLIQPVRMSMVVSRCMQTNAHWLPYLNIEMKLDHIEVEFLTNSFGTNCMSRVIWLQNSVSAGFYLI